MISTVSLSFDLTYTDPITGTIIPRCVVTDSTTYPFPVALFGAKGYGVLTFNGDLLPAKNTVGNPLIDLEAGDTTGFFDLPLDLNGNVANGVYAFEYSLRLDSTASGSGYAGTVTGGTTFTSGAEWLVEVLPIGSSVGIDGVNNTVAGAVVVGSDAVITLGTVAVNGPFQPLTFNNNVSPQFSATYAYAGCTQTTADVSFIYDCEYGNSGTWSVSNATVLGATEIVTSLNCVINYPSWTSSNPLFNPQVVTTVLPYPTLPGDNTPLATGTYSVSLSQQIQQTQASGLVVLYNNSVIREFAVSCAGTLCGLVPCIESLRAAHAAELIRNRISKYQVFVDNVALYYIEAMNYRACGELDKYKATIDLLQAQLDASGCDCACCDDNSYYWVSNNSANSIIDEILANFQYRLYTGPGNPGTSQVGVELGAVWQDTTTGILYRCTNATAGNLQWEVYYEPNGTIPATRVTATPTGVLGSSTVQGQLTEVANEAVFGATNGLTKVGSNVKLGGALTAATEVNVNANFLTFPITTGFFGVSKTTSGLPAMIVSGVENTFLAQTTNGGSTAGLFSVINDAVDDTVQKNVKIVTSSEEAVGNGFGASLEFALQPTTGIVAVTTSSIKSSWSGAAGQNSRLDITTASAGVESTQLSILTNGDLVLDKYGDGNKIGAVAYNLGVASNGVIVESEFPIYSLIVLRVTQSSGGVAVSTILNTTKTAVTGANISGRPGEFTLSHPDIDASKTSVLVQNGNAPGVTPKVGFVYAEAGAGKINFTTYNTDATPILANGILNNAIVEIKIFP